MGATALSLAAFHANLSAVRLLLDKGADVNVANVSGLRVKNGLVALSRMTALMSAPESSPEVMEALLKAGANVNARDVRGMTPLMLAVATDSPNPRIVRMLLDRGADADVKSTDGERALDWAKKFNQPEILGLLGGEPFEVKAGLRSPPAGLASLRTTCGPPSPLEPWPATAFRRAKPSSMSVSRTRVSGSSRRMWSSLTSVPSNFSD